MNPVPFESVVSDSELGRRGWFVLLLSFLLHLLLGTLYWKWIESQETFTPPPALQTRLVPVSELNALDRQAQMNRPLSKSPQIVESEIAPNSKPIETPTRFLGERTQRVEKESVAAEFGSVKGGAKKVTPPKPSTKTLIKTWGLEGTLPLENPTKEESHGPEGDSHLARGSLDAIRKDVAIGAHTILNTDEYVYASFFNRVKAEVGPRWEPLIQKILREQGRRIGTGTFATETQFWIDSAGQLLRVEISSSSGQAVLDEAARESLRRMPKMPNPPAALKEPDGSYRMQLGFMVFLQGGGTVRTEYVPDPRL